MTLVPTSYWRDWWEDFDRPIRLLDQHFDYALHREELQKTVTWPTVPLRSYFRPWRNLLDGVKTDLGKIDSDEDKYRVILNVQDFSPYEIVVKTIGNSIIVEGNHTEKKNSRDYEEKKFMRRYDLPKGHDISQVMSSLSSDGVLTITAPKFSLPAPRGERIVPINRTRFPAIKL